MRRYIPSNKSVASMKRHIVRLDIAVNNVDVIDYAADSPAINAVPEYAGNDQFKEDWAGKNMQ